jgi:hypothetical protein
MFFKNWRWGVSHKTFRSSCLLHGFSSALTRGRTVRSPQGKLGIGGLKWHNSPHFHLQLPPTPSFESSGPQDGCKLALANFSLSIRVHRFKKHHSPAHSAKSTA